MRLSILLTVAVAALVSAMPTSDNGKGKDKKKDGWNPKDWTPETRDWFEAIGERIEEYRKSPDFPKPPPCDLSKAVMAPAPTPLPAPAGKVSHVAIGRGTQNYTCADSTANTVPVPAGAVATMYNATCLAATYPNLLAMAPGMALQADYPAKGKLLEQTNLFQSGVHFFPDATTPFFDVKYEDRDFGNIFCKKDAGTPAPAGAITGQRGEGFGSVAWLKLSAKVPSTSFKEVYRINTAGGMNPPTCEGMPKTFEVQYATEYWFFN
ncbi:MAG: hypothetical protein M1817_000989 [Caeruleum heppii]|nr:MAG: hypothetical protein M1817_000989 [Caeruleum heppii]